MAEKFHTEGRDPIPEDVARIAGNDAGLVCNHDGGIDPGGTTRHGSGIIGDAGEFRWKGTPLEVAIEVEEGIRKEGESVVGEFVRDEVLFVAKSADEPVGLVHGIELADGADRDVGEDCSIKGGKFAGPESS